jgi:hypothetical protein
VQPRGGQRGRQGELDQGESPRRDSGTADRGARAVDEEQVVPGDGLARGPDRAGERAAVRRPVQQGKPEYLRVPAPGQPQARHPVEELIQAVDALGGNAEDAPGDADQPRDEPAQEPADVLVAQGEQHGGTGDDEHERAEETGRRRQRRGAGQCPYHEQEGQRRGGEDGRDGEGPAGGRGVDAVPAELPVGIDHRQLGAGERDGDRQRVRRVGDRHHRAEARRPAVNPHEQHPAEPEAGQGDRLRRQGEQEPCPVQAGQDVQRLGKGVALDHDDADQNGDGECRQQAAPQPVPARGSLRHPALT